MKTMIALCLSLMAGTAFAQSTNLPDLFKVVDVAASDKLNIRSQPSATSDVVGAFEPNQQNIEVVQQSSDGSWSLVNSGEATGWVATQFLAAQPDVWQSGQLPKTLICSGTEPFWSLSTSNQTLTFAPMEGGEQTYSGAQILDRGFEGDRNRVILAKDGEREITAVIRPGQCNDGMSDRRFGLSATLIFQGAGTPANVNYGCCSISAR